MVPDGNGEKKAEHFQSLDKQGDGLPVPMMALIPPPPAALMDDNLPNEVDSLSGELNCLGEDGLDLRPVASSLLRRPVSYSVSSGDPKLQPGSAPGTTPHSVKITPSMFEGSNEVIKIKVMKEVRKPGRSECWRGGWVVQREVLRCSHQPRKSARAAKSRLSPFHRCEMGGGSDEARGISVSTAIIYFRDTSVPGRAGGVCYGASLAWHLLEFVRIPFFLELAET